MTWLIVAVALGGIVLGVLLLAAERRLVRDRRVIRALASQGWLNSAELAVVLGYGDDAARADRHLASMRQRRLIERTAGGYWQRPRPVPAQLLPWRR